MSPLQLGPLQGILSLNKTKINLGLPAKPLIGRLRDVIRQTVDFFGQEKKKTFDVTSRFVMLDMRWKGLDRAMNLS